MQMALALTNPKQTQNAMRIFWTQEEVDEKLHAIMKDIHEQCRIYGQEGDYTNYVKGANIAGFVKLADAMLAFGAV